MSSRTKNVFAILAALIPAAIGYGFYRNIQIDQRQSDELEARVEQTEESSKSDVNFPAEETEVDSEDDSETAVLVSGVFGRGERDYNGAGSVDILLAASMPTVRLNSNFSVTDGPDLFVYLSPNANPIKEGLGEFVSLGALQAETGRQTYSGPENIEDFASVVIWCRSFEGVFSFAELN